MSINRILEHSADTALTERIRRLEENLRSFKSGVQYPTILTTEASNVAFSLQDDAINAGGNLPTVNIKAELSSPTGKTLFAIPEASLFWGSYPAPSIENEGTLTVGTDDRQFPRGARFASFYDMPQWWQDLFILTWPSLYGRIVIDMNWWYDWLWSFTGDGAEVAMYRVRIDSALQNQNFPAGQFTADWGANGFTLYQWWRYLSPGAETL